MIKTIYSRALTVLSRKPLKLWGLSLLSAVFIALTYVLFGVVPGIALAIDILLSVSMTMVFLHGYLGEEVAVTNLFECFKDWTMVKRFLLGLAYTLMWVLLWALIPVAGIVFAVIRSYEYALTPYILVNEPEIPITEAYKVSKQRMEGFKSKMFWADMLWILVVWAAVIILALLAQIKFIGVIFGIVLFVFIVCALLFGRLFNGLVDAAFYVEIQRETGEGPQFDDSMNNPVEKPKAAIVADSTEGVKFCTECGARNPLSGKFCTSCGHPFAVASAPVKEAPSEEAEDAAPAAEDAAE